jgi:hypothetical protein
MAEAVIRMDIWGRHSPMQFLARRHFGLPRDSELMASAIASELRDGFLVQVCQLTAADSPSDKDGPDFDDRATT